MAQNTATSCGTCQDCGGLTVTLRAGLCAVCVYSRYTKSSGLAEVKFADAVGAVLSSEQDR
jgi:hypothetical protein